ncbi:LysR family transcriptional regulator [Jannaschia sp. 2305UL9-9]|uniref:LysR family transcriptional regulator n=1 Tax=Jannaschia sp. 2305UL9-9 TaxID=3121638 RepID=UPI0035276238
MSLPRVTLQSLEAFERVARTGSVQAAAAEMGLSISSVSHQVARLEDQLGATLLDRRRRPFALTREGREVLPHMAEALRHLRRASSGMAIGGLMGARSLRLGIVEDFESRVTPDLAVALAAQMPQARLSIRTVISHEAPALLRQDALDMALVSTDAGAGAGLRVDPILRDPFVAALPADLPEDPARLIAGQGGLPFLRFNRGHMIGAQVEAHLARNRVTLPDRFAFDSAQSIMAVIASGGGWSILTPLGFARTERFQGQVRLHPLPLPSFSRSIALVSRPDGEGLVAQAIARLIRDLTQRGAVDPVLGGLPWLSGDFRVLDPAP